jgi:hypothetical protein
MIGLYECGQPQQNDTNGVKAKDSEKTCRSVTFALYKSHIDWPGREPGPPQWETGD